MNTKKILFIITGIALISYAIWEYSVQQWAASQEPAYGPLIRVDLLLIYPALLILLISTGVAYYRGRKSDRL